MPPALAAAHIGHEIEHSSALMGFLIGAAVGLAVGALIVAATVATGGAALAVVAAVGGAVAATGGGALSGMYIGAAHMSPKGPISSGSPNVFYGPGRIPAARAIIDTVTCQDHGQKFLATGSDSVFINEYPAVRDDDKSECDGTVKSEFDNIFIGAETAQYLEIDPEVPEWMVNVAMGMVIVGGTVALVFGAAAAASAAGICGLINFGGTVLGGVLGSAILAPVGGMIGESLGGELGKRIGETVGGFLGGLVGGGLGNRLSAGHPVDVATGELYTSETDFVIGGIISVAWERFWISSSTQHGALGAKWHHPLDMAMAPAGDYIVLRVEHGRLVLLPQLRVGQSFYHRAEKLVAMRKGDTDWTIRKSNGLLYQMKEDPTGRTWLRLSRIEDDNGNCVTVEYDDRGNIREVIGSDGLRYLFISDLNDRIKTIERTDGKHRVKLCEYHYDSLGDLVAAADPHGVPIHYEYRAHLMTKETMRGGLSYHFKWDNHALGLQARCVSTWGDGELYRRNLEYFPGERITRVTNAQGASEIFEYDENGLVTYVRQPLGQASTLKYNRFAEPEQVIDPNGAISSWRYDAFGRVVETVNRGGAKTRFKYQADNPENPNFFNIYREVDGLDAETAYEYDARGNLVVIADALGNETRILRDQRGLPLNLQDSEGTVVRFSWTPTGRLREERTSKGGRISLDYDGFGRVIRETVENIEPTTFDYDSSDRVTHVHHPNGRKTVIDYDADGNIAAMTAPSGKTTRWEYGGLPAPLMRINADGTRFSYRYDTEMSLVELTNEVGDTYRLEYDLNQRMKTEIGFDGRHQTYTYDDAGYVVGIVDGHRKHKFQRDLMGRLLRRDSSDGSWASYTYDLLGRMLRADNDVRKISYSYDAMGQVIAEIQDDAELTHTYSPRGRRIMSLLPDGRLLRFGYDQNGDFDSLILGSREIMKLDRDRIGRIRRRQGGAITQTTDYDPQGRISRQLAYRNTLSNPIFGRIYSYDPAGRISSVVDVVRGEAAFQFDDRYRLRRVLTSESEEFFEFDPANTILVDVRNVRDASVQGGRVLMRGDCHYEYDDAGNRVRLRRGQGGAHIFRYVYDDMNNLIEVCEERGRTRRITRFAYDALTRRVSKAHREIMEAANSPLTPDREDSEELVRDETTWFLWNGDVLLAEGRSSGTGTFDPLALVYVYEPDSFRPAAQILRHSADAESKILLYWLDHIGTPQELSNENGELVWQVALKAWGKTARVFVGRVSQNLRFQGQYYDEETGLHYNRFRHYDPSSGIFLSQDPIALLGGERPFSYPTNPMNQVDPLGLIDPGDTNGGKGYVVYQLVDRKTGEVKYVGITEADRYEQRMAEHRRSGRYHGGLRDGTITNTSTYGAARGAEQYHIEHANNGKGTLSLDSRGKPLGKGTEGNRARSYDPARTDRRATAYKNEYDNERRRVTSIGLGCN